MRETVKELYEKYPFYTGWHKEHISTVLSRLKKDLAPLLHKGVKVLDVGCGSGYFSIPFALLGADVDAIDISEANIKIAESKAGEFGVNISFYNCDFFKFQGSGKYDIVWCHGVLHHLDNPHKGFKKIVTFVKDRGYAVLGLYNKKQILTRVARWGVAKFGGITIDARLKFVKKNWVLFWLMFYPFSRWWKLDNPMIDRILVDFFCHVKYTYFTMEEVQKWLNEEGLTYLRPAYDYKCKIWWKCFFYRHHPYVNEFFTILARKEK